jgi:hypothetical protein
MICSSVGAAANYNAGGAHVIDFRSCKSLQQHVKLVSKPAKD